MKYKAMTKELLERFQEVIDRNIVKPSHTSCWIWYGQRDKYSYGVINIGDSHYFVHRLMYRMVTGSLNSRKVVRHLCNNPSCCNPEHLVEGTQADNMLDAKVKGRIARGERVRGAKLTADKVRSIRSKYSGKRGEQARLAREFGVDSETIRKIVIGENWKHI